LKLKEQWCVGAALSLLFPLSALAAVAPGDIQTAIEKANILAAGTSMNVTVSDGNVVISTYRRNTVDKDCKIDAVLIARAAMTLAPSELNRVTIYFYSRADLTHYKEISLSAGDIKAFGAGDINKEQLLSSVALIDHSAQDAVSLSQLIGATEAKQAHNYEISSPDNKGNIDVKTQLESWIPDADAKYQALKLADKIVSAAPAGSIKNLHITFTAPDSGTVREVEVKAETIASLQKKIFDALAIVPINAPTGIVAAGPMETEREAIAGRIKVLEKAGVGMALYNQLFATIEQHAKDGNETAVATEVKQISEALDRQEKTLKEQKERLATAGKTPEERPSARILYPASRTAPKEQRWVLGTPVMESAIIKDPFGLIAQIQPTVKNAETNPKFYHLIRFFAQTLYAAGSKEAAAKFDQRAFEMETKYPQLKQ